MNQPSHSDGGDRTDDRHQVEPPPRWVKVFGGILVVLLLVFVAMHLAGGGFGGHRR